MRLFEKRYRPFGDGGRGESGYGALQPGRYELVRTQFQAAVRMAGLDGRGGRVSYDAMLAAYLLNPNASDYSLKRLQEEAGTAAPKLENETAWQAAVLPRVKNWQAASLLANGQQKLLEEMEIPLAQVLARMENIGFLVDGESIRVYGERLETEIEALQKQIYEEVGYEFNINSPKQLGDALFVKLGLPSGKKTKTGYSTNAEILEKLRYDHPAVELVLHYRTLTKLKSTYCEGMLKVIGPDGRIHSNFNQTETRTGRISSTEPNLQNIPVRTELGRELRKFFLAKEGWVLVDADYSQIELRVLAHIAHDENMIKAFQDKEDIHTITASQVFGMPPEMVTPLMRSRAKAVNFRHCLRHRRVFPVQGYQRFQERGSAVYRRLPYPVFRCGPVYEGSGGKG